MTSDEFAELANHSPQRFGLVLASLRQQRIASAAPHSGDNSAVVPPVPIPNTAVKRCSPDGSTATGRARVGRRQSRMSGGNPIGHFAFLASPTRLSRRGLGEGGSGEHGELGSRRVAGQARAGSGRACGHMRVNRTSLCRHACPASASIAFHSSALNFTFAVAIFSSRCAREDVPGIGSITGDRCSSHARPS